MRGLFKNRFTTLSLSLAAMLVLAACGSSDNGGTPDVPTLTVNVVGEGSVTSDPTGINTAADSNSADFEAGTSVTLTADAEPGVLISWSAEQCPDGAEQCVIEIGEDDQTVTVTFTEVDVVETDAVASSSSEEFLSNRAEMDTGQGAINFEDDNLELGFEPRATYEVEQLVALRFADAVNALELPEGAVVTNAYFEFTSYDYSHGSGTGSDGAVELEILAAEAGDEFVEEVEDLSSRATIGDAVQWTIGADEGQAVGDTFASENIAQLVNALLEADATDFVFLIRPGADNANGWRSVYSAFPGEGNAGNAPMLFVEYYVPGADDGGEGEDEA